MLPLSGCMISRHIRRCYCQEDTIPDIVYKYFKGNYRKRTRFKFRMKGNLWEEEDSLRVLEEVIMNEEIKRAAWDLGPNKAPGPNGFPIFFFREF